MKSDTRNWRLTAFMLAAMILVGAMSTFVYRMVFDQYNLTTMQHVQIVSVLLTACVIIAVLAHKIQAIAREDPEGFMDQFELPENRKKKE